MSTQLATSSTTSASMPLDRDSIHKNVQTHYGSAAAKGSDASYSSAVASAFGYSADELMSAPSESNLGLSCGNPFAMAKLRPGETVVDLGSGAGFDVFQAAVKVGPEGKVVGVDMNEEMLERARGIKRKVKADNVSFVESRITKIDYPGATADCVISNCVVNLVPAAEKQAAFDEMFRLLKPGGRIAISDILLKQDLPEELKSNVALYVGCVAGASRVDACENYMRKAGFKDILTVPDHSDLNVYKTAMTDGTQVGCCGSGKSSRCAGDDAKTRDLDLNEWAGSFKMYAVKAEG